MLFKEEVKVLLKRYFPNGFEQTCMLFEEEVKVLLMRFDKRINQSGFEQLKTMKI